MLEFDLFTVFDTHCHVHSVTISMTSSVMGSRIPFMNKYVPYINYVRELEV